MRALLAALRGDERGATAPTFAIVFTTVLMTAAVAIDFARGSAERTREQWALDAAALAASDVLGQPDQATAGPARAQAFFQANTKANGVGHLASINFDPDKGEISATAQGSVMTTLMKVFGYDSINVKTSTTIAKGSGTMEVSLVLDNSGSMAGTYIEDLKTAALSLVGKLYTGAEGTDKVKVGVVPFAGSVNVGAGHRGAAWIDNAGESPVHYENVSENRTRFQLFDDMGVAWAGCVEVRPNQHAYTDSVPSGGESLFVPMLAPDEPDGNNDGGYSYPNSYLVDDGGTCTPQPRTCTRYNSKGNCTNWYVTPLDPAVAQARTCKYQGQSPSGGQGPNYNCQTKPLLPLTQTKTAVEDKIRSMSAGGTTNIGEGLMWGWRLLSPGEPFTEGRSKSDPNNQKIIVLMTDGENTYFSNSNQNKSTYGAYAYAVKNRLGTTYTDSALRAKMDDNLTQACANAKADNISIYTIAFRLESDPHTQSLLAACASAPDHVFTASDGTALIQAFSTIGRQLSKLRVAG